VASWAVTIVLTMASRQSPSGPDAPAPIWRDPAFQRGIRGAIWGTVLVYMLGALFNAARYGAEGALGWVFLYWEGLFWIQWFWLIPGMAILAFFRRWRTALGVAAAGVIVGAVHAAVLFTVRSIGVR